MTTPSHVQLVTQALAGAGRPLIIAEIKARVELMRPVSTSDPEATIRSAIPQIPQAARLGGCVAQESAYVPDLNDGVRVNIAPLQKADLLAADVLDRKDVDKAIADRAEWRGDERRWVREGKLPRPELWGQEASDGL